MLKWFMDLFFDVEEEVIEEHHENETPVKETSRPIKRIDIDKPVEKNKPAPMEAIVAKEEKRSIFIDDVAPKRQDIPTLSKPSVKENNYDFTPIISPMFGVDEKHQPQRAPVPEIKPEVKNNSALGTIISPIYGMELRTQTSVAGKMTSLDEPVVNIDLKDMLDTAFAGEAPEQDLTKVYSPQTVDYEPDPDTVIKKPTAAAESLFDQTLPVNEEDIFEEEKQPSLFDYLE
ncbi:hypothetical protein SDC9_116902 [bioreactor metagenome]|uniref:Uncharacterized protein n=1 Tax=bioreactor metagenome TaxID=1076179 RepID=A0A645C7K6_9ZZZZ|nr:hypothetical protein [Erysipelotrichaceae bacterium]